MLATDWTCTLAWSLSPVPFRPTTMPYPTSWFSRTPSKDARSLIRTAWALAAKTSRTAQPQRNLIISLSLKWPDLIDEIHQPAGTLAVGDDPFARVADP